MKDLVCHLRLSLVTAIYENGQRFLSSCWRIEEALICFLEKKRTKVIWSKLSTICAYIPFLFKCQRLWISTHENRKSQNSLRARCISNRLTRTVKICIWNEFRKILTDKYTLTLWYYSCISIFPSFLFFYKCFGVGLWNFKLH